MTNSVLPPLTTPAIAIGIRGLPELSGSMIGGGLYALKAETPSARFAVLAGSLSSALSLGMSCTIIVPSKPELFIEKIEAFGNINAVDLIETGRLQIFVTQNEFVKAIFRNGTEGFVQELEQFQVPENSYLIFDQADELLSLHDISMALDQVDILRKWFSEKAVTGLLVFSRNTEEHSNALNTLMDSFTGIARIGGDRDGLEITFDYWQSPEGTLAARNYRLLALESGFYEASTQVPTQFVNMVSAPPTSEGEPWPERRAIERMDEAEDEVPHFFYMDPELSSLDNQMPGVWQQVDSMIGMLHANRNTRSATSIFNFERDTSLRRLAETVHTLRQSRGRRALIVVREKDASLRYQNEALLLRLGINLVIHRDVPVGRIPLLLESLNGQVFTRNVNINFEAALSSVLPVRLRGYLAAARFVREVGLILERAETLSIPSVLIVGRPAEGRTALEILKNVGLTRDADLSSSNGQDCYLFLNACPPSVMRATLDTILGLSAEIVFSDVKFSVQPDDIQMELTSLLAATEHGDLPDYSPMIATMIEPEANASANTEQNLGTATVPARPVRERRHQNSAQSNTASALATGAAESSAAAAPFRYVNQGAAVGTKAIRRATRSVPPTEPLVS